MMGQGKLADGLFDRFTLAQAGCDKALHNGREGFGLSSRE
jgi:hypothetical protein